MVLGRDFRKLDPATQTELRRVAAGMVEAGGTRTEAAAAVGVDRRSVGAWAEAARRRGAARLPWPAGGAAAGPASGRAFRRGRRTGSGA